MSDTLRALLGDKYDDVIESAARDILAAVLPELLAEAWDEGKHSEHTPACRLGDGDCACPDPYRPKERPMSDLTPEMLDEMRRLLDAPPQHITIARDDALALLDAAAERDRLARLLDEPRRSGCAVEIAGVRIAPCDERGQTADMLAADRLRRELAYMAEARDNARAEVERLSAQLDAVRALHGPRVVQVLGATCSAEECDHEDACPLVDYAVCGHCYDVGDGAHPYAYEDGGLQDVAHPCATYRALDATPETGGES